MQNNQDHNDKHWHLDKRLNVTHLLATLGLAGSIMMWATGVETRFVAYGEQIKSITQQETNHTESLRREISQLQLIINRINDKTDRLIERK